ncbi:hypothetical protein SLS64_005682 [Diaporthe eres]
MGERQLKEVLQVPYIIAGLVIAAVGGGLLTTINVATATVKWAAYLTVTGIGIGMSSQLPYTAVQVVLNPADVATGNAVSAAQVVAAGASGLVALSAGSAEILEALRWAYSEALRRVLILCVAAICLAFPAACCMEWLNIRTEAEKRKGDEGCEELQEGQDSRVEGKSFQGEGKGTGVQTNGIQV